MIIKNLIVSGCSFTAGCGFVKGGLRPRTHEDYDKKIELQHDGLKKYFTEPYTTENIRQQVESMMYPALLGKKLKTEITKNLAVAGMGYPIHTRRIFSYLLNNQDKINFNETLVLLQITSLQRAELPYKRLGSNSVEYCFLGNGEGDPTARNYLLNHYNPYYLILKGLYELSLFKGWCESIGVKIIFLDIMGEVGYWKGEEKKMKETLDTINNHQITLFHDYIEYPSIENIISKMDILTISAKGKTFWENGYHSDAHFVPEAHEDIAEKIYEYLEDMKR